MKKVIPPGLKPIAISRETKLRLALSVLIAHCEALHLDGEAAKQTAELLTRVKGVLGARARPEKKAKT